MGTVSKGVAAKAWKKAQSASLQPDKKKKRKQQPQSLANPRQVICYFCNKPGHRGRHCPDTIAGKPPHPNSRQVQWDKDKKKDDDKSKRKGIVVAKEE